MTEIRVLHDDEEMLVVVKPSGVLAQPDHSGDVDVLSLAKQYLKERGEEDPFVGLVHRLDRPTSGIMVLARTSAAARTLSHQFRERTVEKQYLAVVEGVLQGIGSWADYIAKPGRKPKIVSPDHPDAKYATLDWQAIHREQDRSLLQIQLKTGRPHQIRLQSAERGVPVLGDGRYGASSAAPEDGIALHHAVLRVDPPGRSRRRTFVADVPGTWTRFLTDGMKNRIDRMLSSAQPES